MRHISAQAIQIYHKGLHRHIPQNAVHVHRLLQICPLADIFQCLHHALVVAFVLENTCESQITE